MTLLLPLALAIPLSCLALFCSLALAGVMTLGGVMHLVAGVGRLGRDSSQVEDRCWSSDDVS
jgi:hypothetical protein